MGRYIVSAVIGLLVIYLYNIVDGIFVGRGIGTEALGAVNIGVPYITLGNALTAMAAMGGGTVVAVRMGEGDKKGANDAFMTSFVLAIFIALVVMAVGMIFSRQIVDISGANNVSAEMREMSAEYLFYFSAFSVPEHICSCLAICIRNDGSPVYSFVGMLIGACSNIFFDWLFVFPLRMGVTGAAIASGCGQILSLAFMLCHFARKKGSLKIKKFRFTFSLTGEVCRRGLPEAVSQLNTPVMTVCFNIMLARYMGDLAVSAFSVLSYLFALFNAVLNGVAQGLQPLWGQTYGRGDTSQMKRYFRYGMLIDVVLAVAIFAVMFFAPGQVMRIFGSDPELIEYGAETLPVFATCIIPMGANLIFIGFLFSTKSTWRAVIIAVSRGVVVKTAAIVGLPFAFGMDCIWITPFVAECVTLALAVILYYAGKKKKGGETPALLTR